jgi:tetratricopeptide (TPR) repeat protein
VRAIELSELARKGDDALARGNLDEARREYLTALECAPRQKELVLAVAELDLVAGNREHAALGILSDSVPAITAGVVGAELLRITGDRRGALEALDAAIRNEPYAPLRALLLVRKSQLETDAGLRNSAIDAAIGAAPMISAVRWARLELRAGMGDTTGVLEDADFLDSAALGGASKFSVWMRTGCLLQRSGLAKQSARCFERALRYCPDDPQAALGLARSFIESHQPMRAASLLERAIDTGAEGHPVVAEAHLLLAQILAKDANDIPNAIAHVRQIAAGSPCAADARATEARWRQMLGDMSGASVAWARLRETIELGNVPDAAARWLREAAQFEREVRRDLACAERHLAVALRVAPRDQTLATAYREVAAALAVEHGKEVTSSREDGSSDD